MNQFCFRCIGHSIRVHVVCALFVLCHAGAAMAGTWTWLGTANNLSWTDPAYWQAPQGASGYPDSIDDDVVIPYFGNGLTIKLNSAEIYVRSITCSNNPANLNNRNPGHGRSGAEVRHAADGRRRCGDAHQHHVDGGRRDRHRHSYRRWLLVRRENRLLLAWHRTRQGESPCSHDGHNGHSDSRRTHGRMEARAA